ncbi:MAG: hypothetical protein QW597_02410 [Thermoplasmataceae archaeon]
MLYRDVDKVIGYQFSVSMVQNHPLIPLVEKEFGEVPLHLDRTNGEEFIDLFIQGEKARHIESIVGAYSHLMRGDLLTIKLKSSEMGAVSDIIEKILSVKTIIPSSIYLSNSRVRADYRFHVSDLGQISSLAGEILSLMNNMEIVALGPDPGGIQALNAVNRRIPLSFVSFETDLPGEIVKSGMKDAFFEVNYSHSEREKMKALAITTESNVPASWRSVSQGSGLYAADIDSPLVNRVRNDANERHIPRAATIMKINGDKLRASAFLPKALLREYLEMLYVASRKVPDSSFRLSSVRDYSQEIWEWA